MSYENFVRVKVVTPVTDTATSFAILDAVAPQKLPPTDGGYLVLCDSPGNPSWIEVIQYTSRTGLGISGVTRGVEGTTAVAWSGNVYAFQALMAGEANLIQTTLAGKQAEIAPGTTAQYWRGDKSWVDFFTSVRAATLTGLSTATGTVITAADTVLTGMGKLQKQISDEIAALPADVRAVVLTGLSTSTNAVITATDTVLSGLGKLQKQISDAATNLAANVRAVVLTGYVAGSNTALAATDTVLAAFGKVQGQLNAKANAADAALTGTPTAPTATLGTNTTQIANMAALQAAIANLINGAPGALDALNELATALGNDPNFATTMTNALAGKEPTITQLPINKGGTGATTQAGARTSLGLGTAATQTITTNTTDSTIGRLLKVGDFGLGASPNASAANLNTIVGTGFHLADGATANKPSNEAQGYVLHQQHPDSLYASQLFVGLSSNIRYTRVLTGGTWGAWVLVFQQSTILGTVSQTSGVPTGAIIERGSNANGQYVKFADGTLICTKRYDVTMDLPSTYGTTTYYNVVNWSFPATFVGEYPVTTANVYRSGRITSAIDGPSTDSFTACTFIVQDIVSTSGNINTKLKFMAIGRWF